VRPYQETVEEDREDDGVEDYAPVMEVDTSD